ncbi:AI-2E family transporter [Cognatilysobacter bugurensis]|uniref:AI-2E family transporter n=1 Tax=Cognatilysobacter bugurensis TaxID=543356 RepID=A0A918SV47_9GAMM|nr:AI-2E family transporter [Lysobacter bugurensis]GHA69120.1 AI-2E family transporter [Lysobacter bugurensis]
MSHAWFAQRVVIVIALVVSVLALWHIAEYLLLGFGGIVFAVVIRSAGSAVARHLPISKPIASALVVLTVIGAIALAAALLGDEVTRQVSEFRSSLPGTVQQIRDRLAASQIGRAILSTVGSSVGDTLSMTWVVDTATLLLDVLADLAIVMFIAVYLGISPRPYMRATLALIPPPHRMHTQATLRACGSSLRSWLLGQLVAMTFVGALTALGLWLVGVPHALALGILVGLLDFVPVIGPLLGAVPGVVLAYLASPVTALYAIAVYTAVQQVEAMVIQPLAQRWAVDLPPVIGLLAIVVSGAVFGLPGVLFGVPLVVVLKVLVHRYWLDKQPPLPTP